MGYDMKKNNKDKIILRDLAKQVAEIAKREKQNQRRELWRKHNSLIKTRPPVLISANAAWQEIFPNTNLKCEDPYFRGIERLLQQTIFQDSLDDDYIVEPWITVRVVFNMKKDAFRWGPEIKRIPTTEKGGAWMYDPPIKKPEDITKLESPHHVIDEDATKRNISIVRDAIGDVLEVNINRSPYFNIWRGDLSTDSAYLRGLEQVMWDMVDRPEWLHKFMQFLMEGVLTCQNEAEDKGDWQLSNGVNQGMTYSQELPDPKANSGGVKRSQLWGFVAAQEFAQISPSMHEEFLLRYQIPIIEKFGLVAYGCCEDLTQKLDMLKKIPNLRRIAITLKADVAASAKNLKRDYVLSWRPNPADVICNGFYPDRVRKILTDAMEAAKGCNIEILLKDIQTVQGKPDNLKEWVKIARDVSEKYEI